MTARAVVRVGVARDRVKDVDATAAAVAKVVDIDAAAYAKAIRNAGPQQFVEAVELRADDFAPKRAALEAIEGVQTVEDTAQLAPTRRFARALLGTVGPVTAEQLERLGPSYGPGAQVGQFGLEARYEKQLAGTPARKVIVRLADGAPDRTLRSRPGAPGRALRTTLDRDVQTAAETALGDSDRAAALVAVQALDGRRARGRQPARRRLVRPRARRPLPARVDVQDHQHGRAAARRPQPGPDRPVPADDRRRRPDVPQLRGRGGRRGPVRRRTSRSRATPRS